MTKKEFVDRWSKIIYAEGAINIFKYDVEELFEMPVYEYRCTKCGHIREIEQHITDAPIIGRKCPICRSEIKRIISLSSFHLKGDGWFKQVKENSNGNYRG